MNNYNVKESLAAFLRRQPGMMCEMEKVPKDTDRWVHHGDYTTYYKGGKAYYSAVPEHVIQGKINCDNATYMES